ncbi:response regulator [Omnitrophica bacterium]|nr:response regulator [Candidatus Omnitrophota bacterium]
MVKLLVVDDEIDVCKFVQSFFSTRGYQVFTAQNGEQAFKVIEKEDPLIVLQDIRMPGIDGIETLRRMKKKRPNNRVIMVTCVDDIEKMEEAKKLGADGYITKPLVLDDLVKAVNEAAPKLKPNK